MEPPNYLIITYNFSAMPNAENSKPSSQSLQKPIQHPLIKDFINSDLLSISKEIIQLSKIKILKDECQSKTSKITQEIWQLFSNDIPTPAEERLKTELKEVFNSPTTLDKIESLTHKNLFIIAQAFDNIFCYPEKIFERMIKILVSKAIPLSLEDLGQFTFAFARARFPGEIAIYYKIQKFVLTNKCYLSWNMLGNIARGFCRKYRKDFLEYDAQFMLKIYDAAKLKNKELLPSAEDLTNIVDAYAKMYAMISKKQWREKGDFENKIAEIFNDLCPAILKADDLDVHQMVKIVEGYRDVDYGYNHELFKLFEKIIQDLDSLIISKLGLFTRVCFQVGYSNKKKLLELSHKVLENKLKFSNDRLVTTVYEILIGFCSSDDYSEIIKSFLEYIFEIETKDSHNETLWKKDDLSQIHTIYHFYQLKLKDTSLKMPSSLEEKIQEYLTSLKAPRSSKFHKDVYSHLPTQEEYENEFRYYSFFLDIVNKKEKIVIEVDGKYHFYRENNKSKTKDRIKEELLKAEGWKLVRIPYDEWKTVSNKKSYLAEKLA